MQLHHIQQPLVLVKHVHQMFVAIMVFVSKLPMEQGYNVIVQQAGQVHDVNTVGFVVVFLQIFIEIFSNTTKSN